MLGTVNGLHLIFSFMPSAKVHKSTIPTEDPPYQSPDRGSKEGPADSGLEGYDSSKKYGEPWNFTNIYQMRTDSKMFIHFGHWEWYVVHASANGCITLLHLSKSEVPIIFNSL